MKRTGPPQSTRCRRRPLSTMIIAIVVGVRAVAPAPAQDGEACGMDAQLATLRTILDEMKVPVTWWTNPENGSAVDLRFRPRGTHEDIEGTEDRETWHVIASVWTRGVVAREMVQGNELGVTQLLLDNLTLWMRWRGLTLLWLLDIDTSPMEDVELRYQPPMVEVIGRAYGEGWRHLGGLDLRSLTLYGGAWGRPTGPSLALERPQEQLTPWPLAPSTSWRAQATAAFTDPSPAVRAAAAELVWYEARYEKVDISWAATPFVEFLGVDDAAEPKVAALDALLESGVQDTRVAEAVRVCLAGEDLRVRGAASRAAVGLDIAPQVGIEVALSLAEGATLDDMCSDAVYQDEQLADAVRAVEEVGPHCSAVMYELVRGLEQDDAAVRFVAARGLLHLGPAAAPAVTALQAAVHDDDPRVAKEVAAALAAVTRPPCPER